MGTVVSIEVTHLALIVAAGCIWYALKARAAAQRMAARVRSTEEDQRTDRAYITELRIKVASLEAQNTIRPQSTRRPTF